MRSEEQPGVSIVVALFNDAATVEELTDRIRTTLEGVQESFEVLFIDDGSQDGTAAILRRLEAADERIRVFEFTRNFGQAAALACGLFAARGAVAVTLDGDLQNPPEEIPKLLDAIRADAGVATGRRDRRYEGFLRWLGSRGIHWLARRLTRVEIEDFGGNFKAYRRDVLDATKRTWAPGKPFFPLALWLGYPVVEVTVRHEPRQVGGSRYTVPKLLRINFDLITSFSTLPLSLLGLGGALCLALGGLGIVACWWERRTRGFAASVSLTCFAVGAVLLAAGVLGLYLGRIYHLVAAGEPAYVVRRGPQRPAPTP